MSFPANITKHRLALLEMLEEAFRDPGKRSALRTRGISMQPLVRERDEVVIQARAAQDLEVGDVLAFRAGDRLVVHRLVAVVGAGEARVLYEKGDNNLYLAPLPPASVLGVVVEVGTGGRRLPLASPRWRRLGRVVARCGLLSVRLFDLSRELGARLVPRGSAPSRLARRALGGLLRLPARALLAAARRGL